MNRFFQLSVGILVLNLLTGCSIFSFKIQNSRSQTTAEMSIPRMDAASEINDSQFNELLFNTPLPNSSLSLLYTKDTIQRFFNEIENSANALMASSSSDIQRENAQMWQLSASQTADQILALTNQEQIFLETWHYFKQMESYFLKGDGKRLFARNRYIPIGVSQRLLKKLSRFTKDRIPLVRYNQIQSFVENTNVIFANSLIYRSAYDSYLTRKAEFIDEINNSTRFEPAFNYVMNTNRETSSEPFYDDIDNLSTEVVSNTDINIYEGDFFPVPSSVSFPNEEEIENDTSSHKTTQNIISTVMGLVSTMPSNIINNQAVKPLAIEITGALEPSDSDDAINNQALFNQGEILFFPDEMPTDSISENENIRNLMEKMTGKIWTNISNIFPSIIMYLFFGILIIFVIPFLMGYFIGKKRQDPNFTVISSAKNRKALP